VWIQLGGTVTATPNVEEMHLTDVLITGESLQSDPHCGWCYRGSRRLSSLVTYLTHQGSCGHSERGPNSEKIGPSR